MTTEYKLHDLEPGNIVLMTGADEMLKVGPDGFWVRGVKVKQGPGEAEAVYRALKEFLSWAHLTRP